MIFPRLVKTQFCNENIAGIYTRIDDDGPRAVYEQKNGNLILKHRAGYGQWRIYDKTRDCDYAQTDFWLHPTACPPVNGYSSWRIPEHGFVEDDEVQILGEIFNSETVAASY